MQFSFRTLSTFTAALCFLLALIWGLMPQWLLAIWGIEYSSAAGFVARRSAVLFGALGVMFYLVRQAPPSATRSAAALWWGVSDWQHWASANGSVVMPGRVFCWRSWWSWRWAWGLSRLGAYRSDSVKRPVNGLLTSGATAGYACCAQGRCVTRRSDC